MKCDRFYFLLTSFKMNIMTNDDLSSQILIIINGFIKYEP